MYVSFYAPGLSRIPITSIVNSRPFVTLNSHAFVSGEELQSIEMLKETPTITDHIICHSEIYYWQLHSIQNRPRRGELSSIESQKVIINRMHFFLLFLAGAEMKRCTSSYCLLHNRWVIIIIACWRRRKRGNGRIYIAFDFIVAAKETPVIAPPSATKSLEANE